MDVSTVNIIIIISIIFGVFIGKIIEGIDNSIKIVYDLDEEILEENYKKIWEKGRTYGRAKYNVIEEKYIIDAQFKVDRNEALSDSKNK